MNWLSLFLPPHYPLPGNQSDWQIGSWPRHPHGGNYPRSRSLPHRICSNRRRHRYNDCNNIVVKYFSLMCHVICNVVLRGPNRSTEGSKARRASRPFEVGGWSEVIPFSPDWGSSGPRGCVAASARAKRASRAAQNHYSPRNGSPPAERGVKCPGVLIIMTWMRY